MTLSKDKVGGGLDNVLHLYVRLPIIHVNTPAMPMPVRGHAQIGGFFYARGKRV
jgi:hypothetical protein